MTLARKENRTGMNNMAEVMGRVTKRKKRVEQKQIEKEFVVKEKK